MAVMLKFSSVFMCGIPLFPRVIVLLFGGLLSYFAEVCSIVTSQDRVKGRSLFLFSTSTVFLFYPYIELLV